MSFDREGREARRESERVSGRERRRNGGEGERVRVVAEQPLEMQIFGTICRYVGETEMRTLRPQVNSTEIDNPRTWATYSVCEILAERSRYGQPIRCVAIHPAYANPTMSSSTEVRFDVRCKYAIFFIRLRRRNSLELWKCANASISEKN